jgi:hypothetical protein
MVPKLARYALIVLAIVVMSVYLPFLYHKVSDKKVGKTQLFFSPVIKKFVFREMVGEGHNFVTQDESGNDYDRMTFETLIPFVYYKNMDLWGKLPMTIDGRTFDKKTIKENRQVFELKPRMIADHSPRIQVFPLLESRPGVTRLRFPEDVFRMTDRMEFINVEPFDEGFFVVDANGCTYHVKRVRGEPVVVKTPIPSDLGIRNIKVMENKKKEIYGMLLTNKGDIHLITYDGYGLIKLPLKDYNPDTMDLKLLINPLYRTAVYSDHHTIHAVAMDREYRPISRYQRVMFSGRTTMADTVFKALFPFWIKTTDKTSGYLQFDIIWNGWLALIGIALSLFSGIAVMYARKFSIRKYWPDLAVIMFTGIYGLISVSIIEPER